MCSYDRVVAGAVYWGGSISEEDEKKPIKKAGLVLSCSMDSFKVVVGNKPLNKLTAIMDNTSRPLHDLLVRQQSTFSNRLILLCSCSKEQYRRSFVPTAIALYNTSSPCRDITAYRTGP